MNIWKVLHSMQARVFYLFLLVTILLVTVSGAAAVNYPDEDGPLRTRQTFTGAYDIVAAGKGMEGLSSGSLNLTVPPPGTVVAAYLYWAGYDDQNGGDNVVTFQVDTGATQPITAVDTYGPSFWFQAQTGIKNYHFVYFADITALVQPGAHTYTMSDFTTMRREYGFGIMVVYEDPGLTTTTIEIRDGLDSIYYGFLPPKDSPSSLNCITFAAHGTATRVLDFTFFNAGISGADRPNNLYYQTGTGTPPTGIVSTGTVINNPFFSADGLEWDTYTNRINVGPADTYACFQIESVDTPSPPPRGASILWMMGGFSLRQETPTAVSLQSFSGRSPVPPVVGAVSAAALLLGGVALGLIFRRRQA